MSHKHYVLFPILCMTAAMTALICSPTAQATCAFITSAALLGFMLYLGRQKHDEVRDLRKKLIQIKTSQQSDSGRYEEFGKKMEALEIELKQARDDLNRVSFTVRDTLG